MNMMRKNNNRNMKHRGGGGGGRRYNNNGGGGGGNRGANDGQNLQRQKHHATQQQGKYSDMARNAQINGDRVDVEYYLQHVDHYTRVLADITAIEAERHAHHREQHPAPVQHEGNQGGEGSTEGSGDAAPVDATASSEGGEQPQRHQRPRREYSDNGAKEANANTTDIPLPGSILPPI